MDAHFSKKFKANALNFTGKQAWELATSTNCRFFALFLKVTHPKVSDVKINLGTTLGKSAY